MHEALLSANEQPYRRVLQTGRSAPQSTHSGQVNAVTGYSQEVEKYDRATDLEALGGRLIELQAREWKEIAEAA